MRLNRKVLYRNELGQRVRYYTRDLAFDISPELISRGWESGDYVRARNTRTARRVVRLSATWDLDPANVPGIVRALMLAGQGYQQLAREITKAAKPRRNR